MFSSAQSSPSSLSFVGVSIFGILGVCSIKWYEIHAKKKAVNEGIEAVLLIAKLLHGTAVLLCENSPAVLEEVMQSPPIHNVFKTMR